MKFNLAKKYSGNGFTEIYSCRFCYINTGLRLKLPNFDIRLSGFCDCHKKFNKMREYLIVSNLKSDGNMCFMLFEDFRIPNPLTKQLAEEFKYVLHDGPIKTIPMKRGDWVYRADQDGFCKAIFHKKNKK